MAGNRKYTDTDVHRALEEIQNGASISECARRFGIPRSTLSEKRSGRLPIEHRMGPPTILSSEAEVLLVKWIFHLGEAGFPVTKDQLLDSVQMLLNKSKRETIFTNNRPARKWYEGFRRRHPSVAEKQCQNLTSARANITEEGLREWYLEVRRYLTSTGNVDIVDDPSRIYNMDESGFFLNPKPGKVLVRRSQRRVYMKIQGDEKEIITALIGGNACGQITPPLVMFPYQRLPSNIVKEMPPKWAFGRSPTGWMTSEAFYEYVANCFIPWLVDNKIVFPIILFVDGHASHVTYHLSELCREQNIILIALHPNATHLIQPMDVSVFKSMKGHWHSACVAYPTKNNGARVTRERFSTVLQQVLDNDITAEIVTNGFRKSGLYPFNAEAIDYSQLIKKQKCDADDADCLYDIQSNPFLERFERYLDEDVLQSFKNSNVQWEGKCENTSLFEFWRKIGGCFDQQNDSTDETNNVAVISNNAVEVEYIDTTYAECFEIGQIVEIVNVNNALENDTQVIVGSNESRSLEVESSSATASTSRKNCDGIDSITAIATKMKNIAETKKDRLIDDIGSDTADIVDSNDDASSTDEETTTDLIDADTASVAHIPSDFPKHFQEVLFWPGRPSDASAKAKSKRKPKEKVPAVLISQDFVAYLKNKEEETVRLDKEKAERKVARAMKNLEKQKLEEEKKKVLLEKKMEKQRKDEEKEKQKVERQLQRDAKRIEKQQKEDEKKAKVDAMKKNDAKKKRKCN